MLLEDRRIDAAEIHVRVQVALDQMLRFQRRHLAVMPAFDLLAEREGDTAGAVIRARAIVMDAAAELGEQQHHNVVGFPVFAKVGHECLDPLRYSLPKIAVSGVLAGMRVERTVVTVEQPAVDLGDVRLRDALELAGNRRVRILDGGRVFLRRDLDNVLALKRVDRGLAEVIHYRAAAYRGAVHFREAIEHLGALSALHLGQEAVPLQGTGDAGDRNARADKGARQAWPHTDNLHDIFLFWVKFARDPAEPAFGPDLFRLAGVPDVHRPEMRAWRVLEADTVQDSELALVPELLHRRHVVRNAVILVEVDDVIVTNPDRRTVIPVQRVVVWDDRIQVVVAAGQLQNDHAWLIRCHSHSSLI